MITPIQAAIISASDRAWRGERKDETGPQIRSWVEALPGEVIAYQVLPDEREILKHIFCHIADQFSCDVILTTGGTGLSARDQTPDATREAIQKEVPGISEAILSAGLMKTPFSMLSRAVSGVRGKTLIINLPGSPEGVRDALEVLKPVLIHAVEILRESVSDCQKVRESRRKQPLDITSHSSQPH